MNGERVRRELLTNSNSTVTEVALLPFSWPLEALIFSNSCSSTSVLYSIFCCSCSSKLCLLSKNPSFSFRFHPYICSFSEFSSLFLRIIRLWDKGACIGRISGDSPTTMQPLAVYLALGHWDWRRGTGVGAGALGSGALGAGYCCPPDSFTILAIPFATDLVLMHGFLRWKVDIWGFVMVYNITY